MKTEINSLKRDFLQINRTMNSKNMQLVISCTNYQRTQIGLNSTARKKWTFRKIDFNWQIIPMFWANYSHDAAVRAGGKLKMCRKKWVHAVDLFYLAKFNIIRNMQPASVISSLSLPFSCSRKCLREEHCARGAVNEFRELFLLRLCWWLQPSSETVSSRGGMIKVKLMLFSILRDCRNDHWILFLSNFPLCASGLTCGMNFLYCDSETSPRGGGRAAAKSRSLHSCCVLL